MPTLIFPPKNRLLKKHEFDHVFQNGLRLVSKYFVFIVISSATEHSRLGIVVSKRKCRLSVDRNRIKRVIREHFRQLQHQLPGVDLVVLLKSPIENSHDPAISACLEKQFVQLKARCKDCVSD